VERTFSATSAADPGNYVGCSTKAIGHDETAADALEGYNVFSSVQQSCQDVPATNNTLASYDPPSLRSNRSHGNAGCMTSNGATKSAVYGRIFEKLLGQ